MSMSHHELTAMAVRWLLNRRGCCVVLRELVSAAGETPDALGWLGANHTILVECKSSTADYRADRAKPFRRYPELGMGRERWYMTPLGLPGAAVLSPPGWGWIEVDRAFHARRSSAQWAPNHTAETTALLSAMRRGQGSWSAKWYKWPNKRRAVIYTVDELPPNTGGNAP